jgi:hypothetical protein
MSPGNAYDLAVANLEAMDKIVLSPLRFGADVDMSHDASVRDEALVHLQQARGFANYLEGGKNHGGVTSEHHMDNREAADSVREELDKALQLLGLRA